VEKAPQSRGLPRKYVCFFLPGGLAAATHLDPQSDTTDENKIVIKTSGQEWQEEL
jgi:hypothetical protein